MKVFLGVLAALALFALPSAPASAWTVTSVEPVTDETGEVVGVLEEGEEPMALLESAATGCKKVYVKYTRTNGGPGPASNDVWAYRMEQGFCWNSNRNRITSLYGFLREPICCDPFWSWAGHVALSTTGGVGQWRVSRYTKGHFKLCFPWLGCVDHDYPWLRLTLYGTGNWTRAAGNS
jgi:hypothetical protein